MKPYIYQPLSSPSQQYARVCVHLKCPVRVLVMYLQLYKVLPEILRTLSGTAHY